MSNIIFENIKNSKVLLRCDFNEPITVDKNNIQILASEKRIDANMSTVHELLSKRNKIILISHHSDKSQTLLPVYNYIKKTLAQNSAKTNLIYLDSTDQNFISEYFLKNKKSLPDILLLENTRLFGDGLDEKNDLEFSKFLASFSEYFVYDAFSVTHRSHSSTVGVANILPTCLGPVAENEYSSLSKILKEINNTFIIMGGAKLSTKLPIIEKFLDSGATVAVCGAMVHLILKYEGVNIKNSFVEKDFDLEKSVLEKLLKYISEKKLIIPDNFIWDTTGEKIVDSIFDLESLEQVIGGGNIKNILWNGPAGMYEEGDITGTYVLKDFLKNAYENKIFTIVGGGDTITFLEKEKDFEKDFSYVSLSGGAMLSFLAVGTLPILKLVKNKSKW